MSFETRKISLKTFVESHFGYCPLTWMFHGRRTNPKIDHTHERALRLVYKSNILLSEELLELDKSLKIHQRNIQSLAMVNSEHFGISYLTYMAAKVWDTVPYDMKNVNDI